MQDRLAEAAPGGELRVDVQRVPVPGQPVDQGLLRPGGLHDPVVGLPVRPFPRRVGAALAAEAALAADEGAAPRRHQRLAGGRVHRRVLGHHQRPGPLVVDAGHRGGGAHGPLDRERPVELEGLLGVHQQGPVEVAERASRPGLRDQDAERRQHLLLDALAVLRGELEFLQRVAEPGPHPDRVEQRVLAVPGPLLRLARHSDQGVVKPHDNLRTRRDRPKLLERRSRTNSQPRPHPCQPALRP